MVTADDAVAACTRQLNTRAACSGNQGSSYLTIMSLGGLEFGILNILGSFGLVWCVPRVLLSPAVSMPQPGVPTAFKPRSL